MKDVTWDDIGIPKELVSYVKEANMQITSLDLLHSYIIHRKVPITYYHYICHSCTKKYEPRKSSEEVSFCPTCQSYDISTNFYFIQPSSNKSLRIEDLIQSVIGMYSHYHSSREICATDCNFVENGYQFGFNCGEKVIAKTPKIAIMKAAILCPFLWDFNFDWSNYFTRPNKLSLTSILGAIIGAKL